MRTPASISIVRGVAIDRPARARRLGASIGLLALLGACGTPVTTDGLSPSARASDVTGPPASSGTSPTPTPLTPTGWSRFTSLRFDYSVPLPEGWVIEEIAGVGGDDATYRTEFDQVLASLDLPD